MTRRYDVVSAAPESGIRNAPKHQGCCVGERATPPVCRARRKQRARNNGGGQRHPQQCPPVERITRGIGAPNAQRRVELLELSERAKQRHEQKHRGPPQRIPDSSE